MSLDEVLKDLEQDTLMVHDERHEILKRLKEQLECEGCQRDAREASLLADVFALGTNRFTPGGSADYERFHPMFQAGNRAYPVLDNLHSEDWDILRHHANKTQNPAMKARYADVLWEYTKDHEQAAEAICAYIEYASACLEASDSVSGARDAIWQAADALPRAIQISLQINNSELTKRTVEATTEAIREFIRIEETDPIHLLADSLIENRQVRKLIDLSALRDSIEEAVEVTRKTQDQPVFTGEQLLTRLRRLAEVTQDKCLRREALLALGELYEEQSDAECQRSHLVAADWYRKSASVLQETGSAEEALRRVLIKHQEANAASVDDMKQFSAEMSIPKEEFEAMLNQIREAADQHSIAVLAGAGVLPSPGEQREAAKENAKRSPLSALLPHVITDGTRVTKSTDGIDENIEHMVTQQVLWGLQCQTLTIAKCAVDHLSGKGTSLIDAVTGFLLQSGWMSRDRIKIIGVAMQRYVEGDFVSAVHVLTPQIEGLIRDLVGHLRAPTTKLARGNTTQYRALDELLREPQLVELFGSDLVRNLRIILTEQIGLNIRNEVCHGEPPPSGYTEATALILIVVLCQLAAIRASLPEQVG